MAKIGATTTPIPEMDESRDITIIEEAPELFRLFQVDDECICEFGDVILVVNDGFHPVIKLQVSSCVLAMSSKVFRVLFSKRFSEGQKAEGRRAGAPREVELQDNPTPMRQMLQLLHHQAVKGLDSATTLFDFALVVDKYDCAAELNLQVDALLSKQHKSQVPLWKVTYHFQHLLAAALLLDQPRHFRHFGERLIVTPRALLQAGDFTQKILDIFPEKLLNSLLHQQNLARYELILQVGCLVAEFRTACSAAGRQTLLVELMDVLCRSCFFLAVPSARSLEEDLNAFDSIELPVIALTDPIEKPERYRGGWDAVDYLDDPGTQRRLRGRTRSWTSDTMTVDVTYINAPTQRSLKERANKVRDLCQGVCLDCIKGQECREGHWPGEKAHGGVLTWDHPGPSLELVTEDGEW